MKYLFCLFALVMPASAAFTISLPGTVETATWNSLDPTSNPGFPIAFTPGADGAWPGSISANGGSENREDNSLRKISGGGGLSSGNYIYTAFLAGTFGISDSSPLSGLETIVFQMDLNNTPLSIALNYNGGSQAIVADYFNSAPGSSYTDHVWQWDLRDISEEITSYEIVFSVDQHTALKTFRVDASDSYVQVVPEPTAGLLGLASAGLLFARRRRG